MLNDVALRRTLETLLSPLGAMERFPDSWRDAVAHDLRLWTEADAGFFRLPDGSPTRVDPLSSELLAARNEYREGGFRDLDPWATRRVGPGEVLIGGFRTLLGEGWRERSAYHRDFLAPRRITNYVGAQIGTERGGHVVLSYFDLRQADDEAVIARTVRRLHAVVPALQAGLEVWLAMRPGFTELDTMVDEVPEALFLCDESGIPLHANSALNHLVATDPEPDRLHTLLEDFARDFASARSGDVRELYPRAAGAALHTAGGTYMIHPVVTDGRVRGGTRDGEPGILLMVRLKHGSLLRRDPGASA